MGLRDSSRHENPTGYFLGVGFVVLTWALNFSMVRIAYREWAPQPLMLVRALGVLLFVGILAKLSGVELKARKELWPSLLFAGFMSWGLYMVLFLEGMQRTGAAQGAITMATAPLFIALISFFRKEEKPTLNWALGSALAFLGVVLTHLEGLQEGSGQAAGFLLVLTAAVVWAVAVHLFRPLVKELGALSATTLSMPGALIIMIPYAGWGLLTFDYSKITLTGWGALAYLILVAGSISFVVYYWAIHHLGAAKGSLTQYLIPPTAALFAVVVLGDKLHVLQVVGLLLALAGVGLAQMRKLQPETGKMTS